MTAHQERVDQPARVPVPADLAGRGACSREDAVELFFHPVDERGGDRRSRDLEARRVCGQCPVFDLCAQVGARESFGVWAGECRECPSHGTASSCKRGCKCDECLRAHAGAVRASRARTRRQAETAGSAATDPLIAAQDLTDRIERQRAVLVAAGVHQAATASLAQVVRLTEIAEMAS